jgi:hypothetical protein
MHLHIYPYMELKAQRFLSQQYALYHGRIFSKFSNIIAIGCNKSL